MPVTTRQFPSVLTVTVAAKSVERPSGYGNRFVPLKKENSRFAHDIALSIESAAYVKVSVIVRAPFGMTRHVSGSALSHRGAPPSPVTERPVTLRMKSEIS